MKIKYILMTVLSIISIQSTIARSLTVINASDYNVVLLPLWSGQGTYDFIPAQSEQYKDSKKTYTLGLQTIQRASWIYLTNQSTGQNANNLKPQEKVKYVAQIKMGPISFDNKTLTIFNNGNYTYQNSNTNPRDYYTAPKINLSETEKKLLP